MVMKGFRPIQFSDIVRGPVKTWGKRLERLERLDHRCQLEQRSVQVGRRELLWESEEAKNSTCAIAKTLGM